MEKEKTFAGEVRADTSVGAPAGKGKTGGAGDGHQDDAGDGSDREDEEEWYHTALEELSMSPEVAHQHSLTLTSGEGKEGKEGKEGRVSPAGAQEEQGFVVVTSQGGLEVDVGSSSLMNPTVSSSSSFLSEGSVMSSTFGSTSFPKLAEVPPESKGLFLFCWQRSMSNSSICVCLS